MRSFLIGFLFFSGFTSAFPADPVRFHVPSATGEPGEEVALGFRADVPSPVQTFVIRFDVPAEIADYTRVELSGTASAHAPPRGITYNPHFFRFDYRGYLLIVRFKTENEFVPLSPGNDLLLVKAIFRIRAGAAAGDYPIHVEGAEFDGIPSQTLRVELEGDGVFRVQPPRGPRPVGDFQCPQAGGEVKLSWSLTGVYDSIRVLRNGKELAVLPGDATSHADRPSPGPYSYSVLAMAGGTSSLPASCDRLVEPARPAAISDLTCTTAEAGVSLAWKNGGEYERLALFRNGRQIADLDGGAISFLDPLLSDLFTVYSLVAEAGGTDALPATCKLNESTSKFVLLAEDVRALPGDTGVPIRIYLTNPAKIHGWQVSFRIDPAVARIQKLTLEGTVSEPLYEQFLFQRHVLARGETGAGISYHYERQLPAGADQHVLTLLVDILPQVPSGTILPVAMGQFGSPPLANVANVNGQSVPFEDHEGAVLIGDSPVPEVQSPQALAKEEAAGGGAAAARASEILLSWTNAARYSAILIERDGAARAEISGENTSFLDSGVGPGIHRYRITALDSDRRSFPVTVSTLPEGVPGTFLRGDANADGRVDLADPIWLLEHLFRGTSQPPCLDAADADDSGTVGLTDGVVLISYLFRGGVPLPPPPGTRAAWFDSTPDELSCGVSPPR